MLEVISITPTDVQKEIIGCLPEIINDDNHSEVATHLRFYITIFFSIGRKRSRFDFCFAVTAPWWTITTNWRRSFWMPCRTWICILICLTRWVVLLFLDRGGLDWVAKIGQCLGLLGHLEDVAVDRWRTCSSCCEICSSNARSFQCCSGNSFQDFWLGGGVYP